MPDAHEASGALQVTLYTKPGCHLCDDLLEQLYELQSRLAFTITERNIEDDPGDFERFQYLVPVLVIPGVGFLTPPHDLVTVERGIESAVLSASGSHE